jgi:3-hydroxyisobutyrate dehydrogenase
MTLRAGFVGIGKMGEPMAVRLSAVGLETIVYDVRTEAVAGLVAKGAKAAGSPRVVAERSDVIGVCVPSDHHVRAVLSGPDGILAGAKPGSIVAVHSTILPSTAEEVAALAAQHGVGLLDACVTGGDERALLGKLTVLTGGAPEHVEKARPYFEAFAERIVHAGSIGMGCKLKLCINVMTYLQWAAAYESFALAKAVGLPTEMLEEAGKANGQLTDLMIAYLRIHKLPPQVQKSDAVQTRVRGQMHTAEKDLAHALELAREAGLAMPSSALVSQLMARIYGVEDPGRR